MSAVDALQAALAGEHACVYGYGLVGAHAGDSDLARSAYELHRARREPVGHLIRLRDGEPVAALPAYETPFPVHGSSAAHDLAALLERRLAAIYLDLVGITTLPGLRSFAATALTESAELAARWSGETTALPGIDPIPEPAD